MGRVGSSARSTWPSASAKFTSRGDFCTMTTTRPVVSRSSFFASSIFTDGGSGASTTAHEESLGKVPWGATRTRITPSRKAVMRTFARPEDSSTPSLSFSTRCTAPACCQPSADAELQQAAAASSITATCRRRPALEFLPEGGISCLHFICFFGSRGIFCLPDSRGQPRFKEGGGLGSLDAAPNGVHHTAARGLFSIERQPIGKMQIESLLRDFELGFAHFEEALLEDYTQNFVAEQVFGACVHERGWHTIPRLQRNELDAGGDAGEFEKVQGAVHCVDREEARGSCSADLIPHAIQKEWDVCVRDPAQWTAAHA